MSQESMSWSEVAELSHATQIEKFNFCTCEEGKQFPYADCPRFCEDCGYVTVTHTWVPYGSTYMPVITCQKCGTSYEADDDDDDDEDDYEGAK